VGFVVLPVDPNVLTIRGSRQPTTQPYWRRTTIDSVLLLHGRGTDERDLLPIQWNQLPIERDQLPIERDQLPIGAPAPDGIDVLAVDCKTVDQVIRPARAERAADRLDTRRDRGCCEPAR
jgi:hypothetical protein